MTLLFRYIFRIAATAFVMTLAVLTAVIWLSQALREFDLMTAKGQSVVIFLMITGLSVPALIAIIAPVALFIATIYTLNRLNGDSELVVMSAAGLSPTALARPFMALTLLGAALVAWMTIWAMPSSFRGVRDLVTKVRADFVSNVAREGQFTNLDQGITFHYRERAGDALLGIFMQDRRDPEKNIVYIAAKLWTSMARPILFLSKASSIAKRPMVVMRASSTSSVMGLIWASLGLIAMSSPISRASAQPSSCSGSTRKMITSNHNWGGFVRSCMIGLLRRFMR